MWQGARIAVIVPAYCEERLIGRTLSGIPAWVDYIVVVDDASTDRTAQEARLVTTRPVQVIRHAANSGVGGAIITGYLSALEQDAEVLAVMAGDNQMHPDDLAVVVAPVVMRQADYVKGNRFSHADRASMPALRRLGGKVLSALTRTTTGLAIDDTQCGFTAISARALNSLPLTELWPRYGYPNDLLGMLAARGLSVREVPVRPVYANESSGMRPWHLLTISWVIVRRWQRERKRTMFGNLQAEKQTR